MADEYKSGAGRAFTTQIMLVRGMNSETLSAAKTLTDKSSHYQILDPNGTDRTITLPAVGRGQWYQISNSATTYGAELLIVNAAGTRVAVCAAGQSVKVVCDASAWYAVALPTGIIYQSLADSTSIAGGSGAQSYDVSYSIPASLLTAGRRLKVSAQIKATGQNGTDTFAGALRVGGQAVATCNALDINANDRAVLSAELTARAAPGASVACVYSGRGQWTTSGDTAVIAGGSANLATNAAMTVDVRITYGSATAGNTPVLESLTVELY